MRTFTCRSTFLYVGVRLSSLNISSLLESFQYRDLNLFKSTLGQKVGGEEGGGSILKFSRRCTFKVCDYLPHSHRIPGVETLRRLHPGDVPQGLQVTESGELDSDLGISGSGAHVDGADAPSNRLPLACHNLTNLKT